MTWKKSFRAQHRFASNTYAAFALLHPEFIDVRTSRKGNKVLEVDAQGAHDSGIRVFPYGGHVIPFDEAGTTILFGFDACEEVDLVHWFGVRKEIGDSMGTTTELGTWPYPQGADMVLRDYAGDFQDNYDFDKAEGLLLQEVNRNMRTSRHMRVCLPHRLFRPQLPRHNRSEAQGAGV